MFATSAIGETRASCGFRFRSLPAFRDCPTLSECITPMLRARSASCRASASGLCPPASLLRQRGVLYSRWLMGFTCRHRSRVYLFAVGVLSGACLPGASPMLLSQPLSSAAELRLYRAFGVWVWHSPYRAASPSRASYPNPHSQPPFVVLISGGDLSASPSGKYHFRLSDGGRSSSRTSLHFHVRYITHTAHGITINASPMRHLLTGILPHCDTHRRRLARPPCTALPPPRGQTALRGFLCGRISPLCRHGTCRTLP